MSVIDLSKSTGQGSDRTVICHMHSKYPVRLMQQSHWIQSYITIVGLGFGGGLVQGDCTSLNILLRDGAEGWLMLQQQYLILYLIILLLSFFFNRSFKTQGSTKVFKCAYDKVCFQRVRCSIRDRSLLVYIPDPTVCFDDANYRQNIRLDVDNSSSLVFVDCFSSGRLV
jgi:urease accessory protein